MSIGYPLPPLVLLVTIGVLIAAYLWVPLGTMVRHPFSLL